MDREVGCLEKIKDAVGIKEGQGCDATKFLYNIGFGVGVGANGYAAARGMLGLVNLIGEAKCEYEMVQFMASIGFFFVIFIMCKAALRIMGGFSFAAIVWYPQIMEKIHKRTVDVAGSAGDIFEQGDDEFKHNCCNSMGIVVYCGERGDHTENAGRGDKLARQCFWEFFLSFMYFGSLLTGIILFCVGIVFIGAVEVDEDGKPIRDDKCAQSILNQYQSFTDFVAYFFFYEIVMELFSFWFAWKAMSESNPARLLYFARFFQEAKKTKRSQQLDELYDGEDFEDEETAIDGIILGPNLYATPNLGPRGA